MNPTVPTHADRELERITLLASNARRLEFESTFFKKAMRRVPPELLSGCELIGVHHIDDNGEGLVRLRLFDHEFDLEGWGPEIRHAHLPFTPSLWHLEDFSFDKAALLERKMRQSWRRSWWPALGISAAFLLAFGLSSAGNGFKGAAVVLGGLALATILATITTATPDGVWRMILPNRMTLPDSVTLEAFEQWRAGNTLESRDEG